MPEDIPDPSALPLFPLQLRDLVLWQLDLKRADQPILVQETDHPDIGWRIEIGDLAEVVGSYAAKLSLDYRFPAGDAPAYTAHIELIGVFVPVNAPAEVEASEQPPEIESNIPLDVNIVTSLMWPYARELVHQLQLRMRVPLFLLPTLGVPQMREMEGDNAQQG